MPDESSLLRSALAAATKENEMISFWLTVEDRHPFGRVAAENVGVRLNGWSNRVSELLDGIEEDLAQGRTADGWAKYTELRQEHMPRLSNELLAVIGGMYLMKYDLDSLGGPGVRPLSFSEVASGLLRDLAKRADRLYGSILIVGEELHAPTGADIIRLRFPACDVWSLPFTAHEYGFLVAHKEPPSVFRDMKSRISAMVDPTQQRDGRPPEDAACYLPEIQQFWERFYDEHQEAEPGTVRLDDADRRRIDQLTELQLAHLCRLFADAFATFFAGPAWVHALLHLRFRPGETLHEPTATMPSFTSRFVFALETLRWMHQESRFYRHVDFGANGPFNRELAEGAGLDYHWLMALSGAGCRNDYTAVAKTYAPWLETIQRALSNAWQGRVAGPQIYERWREAREMEGKLSEPEPRVDKRPHPWAVLNAAWSVRVWEQADLLPIVEKNAVAMLDPNDNDIVVPSSRRPPERAKPIDTDGEHGLRRRQEAAEKQRTKDEELVVSALFGELALARQFDWDAAAARSPLRLLPNRPDIFKALRGDAAAREAYYRLVLADDGADQGGGRD